LLCLETRFDDTYDADPFTYEEEELEPPPPDEQQELMEDEGQLNHAGDEKFAVNQNGVNGVRSQGHQVVASGDVRAATSESKAIPPDQRSTTPYMTKYERARILGTRALQIRYFDS
jgi:DNA-directed RNA polymerases I, II, and III subunit RPABC2